MTKWLAKLFPSLNGHTITTKVVMDKPTWTESDAAQLNAFLQSRAGIKLLDSMRHTVTLMCLDPKELDADASADRRAIAWVLEGVESLSREDFWRHADKVRKYEEAKTDVWHDSYADKDSDIE